MRVFQLFFLSIFLLLISCSETTKETHKYTNALVNESSPYLLQHAHNPVNWQPWNSKILAKAKKENKLILFSIGYASCHWCHVMEKETFEDEAVAKFMNENFINVKVDREEHPDIDKTYIKAVQLMTGNAGWPLNCITLPSGEPVWGGTYFTKENWMNSLEQIVKIQKENPEKTIEFARAQAKRLNSLQTFTDKDIDLSKVLTDSIIHTWKKELDTDAGGLKENEKFPRPSNYNFLLRYTAIKKSEELMFHVNGTLQSIANRGLFDHIEGGFARYTIDKDWNIPHFEKMLYDNAQLISLFSYAYQIHKNETHKDVVYQTLDFIQKQLTRKDHLLYASLNADSENEEGNMEEGAYYVWEKEKLKEAIKEEFVLFSDYFGIDTIPTTEDGKHVLVKQYSDSNFIQKHGLTLPELQQKIAQWKAILLEERKKRVAPETDTKVITSWNALMLKAYADAYKVFGDENLKTKAINTANSIKENLITDDWKVLRSLENQNINGYLEDYAYLIDAFVAVYQITFDEQWLNHAKSLTEYAIAHFYDAEKELFAFSETTAKGLAFKEFDVEDGVMPSANSVMSHNLFKLGHYFGNEDFLSKSKKMLQRVLPDAIAYPYLYANWLQLYLNVSNPYYEVVINGKDAIAKAKELHQNYLPNIILCGSTTESTLPLLENRFYEDKTFIYVCVNRACKLPTESVEKAISLMK
ncbi:thioredoxin domain-containing protein [uncultured Kordia sp.]|uniref:thioredoxin domain-containing protein n=1 Tax=uncultured Kordia sp. TaxID=507699 RepID=UPI00260EA5E9|nr:thioredoxin domain-containing protein [uncultured Kordia sp.]